MAIINNMGNIISRCPDCHGSKSTYEWKHNGKEYGAITRLLPETLRSVGYGDRYITFRLFRCAGCNRGGLGVVTYGSDSDYPGNWRNLIEFYPESPELLRLPKSVPAGIQKEFREAEKCMGNKCHRAASGLFRSVLEKTLRASGYIDSTLARRIDMAADDGILTETRKRRAHEEVRVLGNDVLHDDWKEIKEEEVVITRHYAQRILEDFYDDRESILAQLRDAGRTPEEDIEEPEEDTD